MHGTGSVVIIVSVFFIPLDCCSAIVVLVLVLWFGGGIANSLVVDTSSDITQKS